MREDASLAVRRALLLILVAVIALFAGVWLGGRQTTSLPWPLQSIAGGDAPGHVVTEAIDRVHRTYYREIPREKLADSAIAGVVAKLGDRFSNYFTPAEYRRFQDTQDSRFTGVGVSVSEHPLGLRVARVFDGSPAARAGVRPGDLFVGVNGKRLKGLSSDVSTARIKGPEGTGVTLTIRHAGKRRNVRMTRARVTVPVVASAMRTGCGRRIGVVALSQFSSGAHAEVYAALRRLKARGAKGFVFDLRGNGGGLVTEAQLIASAFLKDGRIVTTRGRDVPERTLRATGDPIVAKAPVAVLVDRDTASASEIVTGALQDRDRATVVGTRTFGKGVFQEVIELSNGGALDITAGQYFTPSGRNLGGRGVRTGVGIRPDVPARDNPRTVRDEALRTALDVTGGCAPRP